MFSKIDKKILIWLIVALVIVALFGIAAYKRFAENAVEIQDFVGGDSIESPLGENDKDIDINLGNVEVEGDNGSGGLTICLDRCGDNVCQTQDSKCPDGSFNCPCAETPQDCPQDCD